MKTLNAATDLFDPIEVDLWGPKFSVRQPTRAVERKVEEAFKNLEALDDEAGEDAALEALAELLDVLLEPIGDEDGKKIHAKTVVRQKYKADEIGYGHVEMLFERISALRSERPT
jgi:hypothetical protein